MLNIKKSNQDSNGQIYVVKDNGGPFNIGDHVRLWYDDNTSCPWFCSTADEYCYGNAWSMLWDQLTPIEPETTSTYVDDIYKGLSEGQRVHMLNKLAKHGYDHRKWATMRKHMTTEQLEDAHKWGNTYGTSPEADRNRTYKVGQRVIVQGNELLITRVNVKDVQLTCLRTGNRWSGFTTPKSMKKITEAEFKRIS